MKRPTEFTQCPSGALVRRSILSGGVRNCAFWNRNELVSHPNTCATCVRGAPSREHDDAIAAYLMAELATAIYATASDVCPGVLPRRGDPGVEALALRVATAYVANLSEATE